VGELLPELCILAYVPQQAQYPQSTGLPTSATRLHQAHWPPPPPWEGPSNQTPPVAHNTIPGGPPGFFQPSPYYRANGVGHPHVNPEIAAHSHAIANGSSSDQRETPHGNDRSNQASDHPIGQNNSKAHSPVDLGSSAPVIDPSLDSADSSHKVSAVSLAVTQAAMQALLQSAERAASVASSGTSDSPDCRDTSQIAAQLMHVDGEEADGNTNMNIENQEHVYSRLDDGLQSHSERPPSMEHVLTEDGEPMLNPGLFRISPRGKNTPDICCSKRNC
jgi:hypothetical protein